MVKFPARVRPRRGNGQQHSFLQGCIFAHVGRNSGLNLEVLKMFEDLIMVLEQHKYTKLKEMFINNDASLSSYVYHHKLYGSKSL